MRPGDEAREALGMRPGNETREALGMRPGNEAREALGMRPRDEGKRMPSYMYFFMLPPDHQPFQSLLIWYHPGQPVCASE